MQKKYEKSETRKKKVRRKVRWEKKSEKKSDMKKVIWINAPFFKLGALIIVNINTGLMHVFFSKHTYLALNRNSNDLIHMKKTTPLLNHMESFRQQPLDFEKNSVRGVDWRGVQIN